MPPSKATRSVFADRVALQFLKNILNRNDKFEHITHLDNVVRIIILWSE